MTKFDIDQLIDAFKGHTPGPLSVHKQEWNGIVYDHFNVWSESISSVVAEVKNKADANLFANAPTLLAALIAEREENKRMREALEIYGNDANWEGTRFVCEIHNKPYLIADNALAATEASSV